MLKQVKLWVIALPMTLFIMLFLISTITGTFGVFIIPIALLDSSTITPDSGPAWEALLLIPASWIYLVLFMRIIDRWAWFNDEFMSNLDSYLIRACIIMAMPLIFGSIFW